MPSVRPRASGPVLAVLLAFGPILTPETAEAVVCFCPPFATFPNALAFLRRWFPGDGEARGNGVRHDECQGPGCPRNCKRRAPASITATGKLGRPDAPGRRPASQETCRRKRHPFR